MTQKQLKKFIDAWQARLRLLDWDISVKFTDEFPSSGQTGSTTASTQFLDAKIVVKRGLSVTELKRTILHELLHVRFAEVDYRNGSALELSFEQGIEMTARALLNE